ncbi:MAG: hypothetical protein HY660_13415 [Armatimonadetes bacterium]|nr:hypothetical protein [Armatimonadota bacterium]
MKRQQRGRRPAGRRVPTYVWALAGVVLVVAVALLATWMRQPAYAAYADGRRPTVAFFWSDPTPHHPGG